MIWRFSSLSLLFIASLLNSFSQILMRWGGKGVPLGTTPHALWRLRWWLLGLFLGWLSGLTWAVTLRKLSISRGWPLYVGLVYVMTMILSTVLLAEGLQPPEVLGAGLILGGIMLILSPSKRPSPSVEVLVAECSERRAS